MIVLKSVLLSMFLFPIVGHCFPEMIKHGYSACITCHSSHVGGDLLTAYGRSVKREAVTSKAWTREEQEQKGLEVKGPEWLQAGANIRLLQYFNENSQKSRGRFLIMQADLDFSFLVGENWNFYSSLGRYEPSQKDSSAKDFIYYPREWITYSNDFFGEEKGLQLRAGKFFPAYGIYQVEHIFGLRRNLDFNPGQERVAFETSFAKDGNQLIVTALSQRANYNTYNNEKGYIVQASKSFENNWRLGANFYRSKLTNDSVEQDVKMEGVFAIVGWDEKNSTLVQFDRVIKSEGREGRNFFLKLDHEFKTGWHGFGIIDYWNPWVERTDPHIESLGVGAQVFWYPNFDIQAFYKKEKNTAELDEYQDVLWFILHSSI